ncbi:SOS response-associated peptidase [Legionella spiritensis]|uniref:Abasic site processing protein n=1 Tax=Legionella spiritensis TaxID=452 RepID=A0A0W0Z5U2_LEGSP|nr:SOS response-associated peptidase [Legionella spiritensis]KTD64485.1 putative SOS response-associated peptidase YedK [Legionella spiritensis]SNV45585.1 Uncharacterised ACR, COG2135 [Legionella spiritensis]
MCGRFALVTTLSGIKAQFDVDELPELIPRFNIAPAQDVFFILSSSDGARHGVMLRWGFIPFFSKEKTFDRPLINARAETVAEKPAFRQSFKSRRGMVIMSGFFEWHARGKVKQPYYTRQKNDTLLAVAGLWDTWQSPKGEVIHSCCLITTTANDAMQSIHTRMPALLDKKAQDAWLDNELTDPGLLQSLLHPYEGNDLVIYPVTPKMNNWRYQDVDAIKPWRRTPE